MTSISTSNATIRDAAIRFHALGLNVIANEPGTKKPAHFWKGAYDEAGQPIEFYIKRGELCPKPNWTLHQQTYDDVLDLPWHKAGALGLVNGPGGLRTLDYDKCPTIAPVKATLAAMGLPDTYPWQGRSGSHNGYCLAFIVDDLPPGLFDQTGILIGPPRQAGDFHQLELRAYGCQTIVAPSLHKSGQRYEWLYGEPTEPPARVTTDQLIAGFLAVAELPKREAPRLVERRQVKPSGTSQAGESPIDAFNRRYTMAEVLEMCGGAQTRDGWACDCGYPHSNPTNLVITDRDLLLAYGPNCGWAPQNLPGNRAQTRFGLYCDALHGGNVKEAVKAAARLLGIAPPVTTSTSSRQAPRRISREQADAYNTNKREKRYAENRAALDQIADGLAGLDFTRAVPAGVNPDRHAERAAALACHLIELAHDTGVLQVHPTNEQIADALGFCVRRVSSAFRELEAAGLGKRTGGRGGLDRPNEPAAWSFNRSPSLGCIPQQEAKCNLVIYREDPYPDQSLASEAPPAALDPFADWEACEDDHGADELAGLVEPETCTDLYASPLTEPTTDQPAAPEFKEIQSESPIVSADMVPVVSTVEPPARIGRSGPRWYAERAGFYTWHLTKQEAQIAAGLVEPPAKIQENPTKTLTHVDVLAPETDPAAGIDWNAVERWVSSINPDQMLRAVEQERHNPELLWTKHEARLWHADERHAPAVEVQQARRQDEEHKRNQTRARWQKWADADDWKRIGEELGKMRNCAKRPGGQWAMWQVSELNALWNSRPADATDQAPDNPPLTSPPAARRALGAGTAPMETDQAGLWGKVEPAPISPALIERLGHRGTLRVLTGAELTRDNPDTVFSAFTGVPIDVGVSP